MFVCVYMYLELDADILRHQFDGRFFDDLKVPGAEDLHGQDTVRFVDSEALTKRLGHAVGGNHTLTCIRINILLLLKPLCTCTRG